MGVYGDGIALAAVVAMAQAKIIICFEFDDFTMSDLIILIPPSQRKSFGLKCRNFSQALLRALRNALLVFGRGARSVGQVFPSG